MISFPNVLFCLGTRNPTRKTCKLRILVKRRCLHFVFIRAPHLKYINFRVSSSLLYWHFKNTFANTATKFWKVCSSINPVLLTNKFLHSHRCLYFPMASSFERNEEFNTMNLPCLWLIQSLFIHTARQHRTITIILTIFLYFPSFFPSSLAAPINFSSIKKCHKSFLRRFVRKSSIVLLAPHVLISEIFHYTFRTEPRSSRGSHKGFPPCYPREVISESLIFSRPQGQMGVQETWCRMDKILLINYA